MTPMLPPRILPHLHFPEYAFLSGRSPHPVRDPAGHSYPGRDTSAETAPARSELVQWGADLFNHGYYWEAHEAWETLWHSVEEDVALLQILKGLILLAATGIKVREGKQFAASRHAWKAHSLFVVAEKDDTARLRTMTGLDIGDLLEWSRIAAATSIGGDSMKGPVVVFSFVINPSVPELET